MLVGAASRRPPTATPSTTDGTGSAASTGGTATPKPATSTRARDNKAHRTEMPTATAANDATSPVAVRANSSVR